MICSFNWPLLDHSKHDFFSVFAVINEQRCGIKLIFMPEKSLLGLFSPFFLLSRQTKPHQRPKLCPSPSCCPFLKVFHSLWTAKRVIRQTNALQWKILQILQTRHYLRVIYIQKICKILLPILTKLNEKKVKWFGFEDNESWWNNATSGVAVAIRCSGVSPALWNKVDPLHFG